MVLVIVSLSSLLCTLYSYLDRSNNLLYPGNKLSMNLTLDPCANCNINGISQLLSKNKLSWRELCAWAYLEIQCKFNLKQ